MCSISSCSIDLAVSLVRRRVEVHSLAGISIFTSLPSTMVVSVAIVSFANLARRLEYSSPLFDNPESPPIFPSRLYSLWP